MLAASIRPGDSGISCVQQADSMTLIRIARNIALSGLAWLVAVLVAAASLELTLGQARPGFVPIVTLALLAPLLYVIWRPRRTL